MDKVTGTTPYEVATNERLRAIRHLEVLRKDARDEIKQRIKQRDQYSVQLTISLGVIVGVAFAAPAVPSVGAAQASITSLAHRVLLAAPLVSVYFTTLVLYSYRVHGILVRYLREEIEPALANLCGTDPTREWEVYYQRSATPGIRRQFFIASLWAVCIISSAYIGFAEGWRGPFMLPLIALTGVFSLASAQISRTFWRG